MPKIHKKTGGKEHNCQKINKNANYVKKGIVFICFLCYNRLGNFLNFLKS